MEDWVCCKDCIYLEEGDCDKAESRDGCCFGLTKEMLDEVIDEIDEILDGILDEVLDEILDKE